jgi:hypothetical protein
VRACVIHVRDPPQVRATFFPARPSPPPAPEGQAVVDHSLMRGLFDQLDTNGDGSVTFEEFEKGLTRLNVAPRKGGESSAKELRISLDDPI